MYTIVLENIMMHPLWNYFYIRRFKNKNFWNFVTILCEYVNFALGNFAQNLFAHITHSSTLFRVFSAALCLFYFGAMRARKYNKNAASCLQGFTATTRGHSRALRTRRKCIAIKVLASPCAPAFYTAIISYRIFLRRGAQFVGSETQWWWILESEVFLCYCAENNHFVNGRIMFALRAEK